MLVTEGVDLLRDPLELLFGEEPRPDLLNAVLKVLAGIDRNPLIFAKQVRAVSPGEVILLRRSERE